MGRDSEWFAVLQALPGSLFMLSPGAAIRWANPAALRLTGRAQADVQGRSISDFLDAAEGRFEDVELPVVLQGVSVEVERQVVHAQGRWAPVLFSAAALTNEGGEVDGIVCVLTDLSERHAIEEEIRQSRSNLLAMINNTSSAICSVDFEGRLIACNATFSHVFRLSTGVALQPGMNLPHALPLGAREEALAILERARQGETFSRELRLPSGGETLDFALAFNPVWAPDGSQVVGVALFGTDVTVERLAAEALRKARDAAEAAARTKSAFLATMSHEIRTPLNGVIGMADLLARSSLSPEQRDYVHTIRRSSDLLLSVLNDVLHLSRLESGVVRLEQRSFEMAGCLEEVAEVFGAEAARQGIELICDVDPILYGVEFVGDDMRIRQILGNLVSNALKFTPEGFVVLEAMTSTMEGGQEGVEVRVSDTGIGVPRDRLSALFEPFEQADASTTRRFGGTGLGLTIALRLAKLMGGTIRVESEEGKGSRFSVLLPLTPAGARSESRGASRDLEGSEVLLIERSPRSAQAIRRALEHAGARVEPASDEREGLRLLGAHANRFACVIRGVASGGDAGIMTADQGPAGPGRSIPQVLLIGPDRSVERPDMPCRIVSRPVRPRRLVAAVSELVRHRPEQHALAATMPEGPLASGRRLRVLVAEDNAVNRKVIVRMLEELGYGPDVVTDGAAALAAMKAGWYDAVLLDIEMPEMDGLEVARKLRETGPAETPYLIAMTAHAVEGDRERFLACGMNDYLGKPVRLRALQEILARVPGGS